MKAKITGLATYVPPRLLRNSDLEKLVDTNNEWILERTGIEERHVVDKGVATSDLAAEAIKKLLKEKELSPDDIDLVIVATVTPDMMFPSTACLVQHKIGATKMWGFDLSAACCGFVFALSAGAQFVHSGMHRRVLVVGADVMSSIINYSDRTTCVLFGDGAGVVLLEPCKEGEGIIDYLHEVDGSGGAHLNMPAGGSLHPTTHETVEKRMHFVHQQGQQVFKYAVKKMGEYSQKILEKNQIPFEKVDVFIAHQANLRIINATAERLGLSDDKVIRNIHKYGNTTAATIPLAMQDAIQDNKLKKDGMLLLAAVGAGYTVGAMVLRWAY
ncbi:ketoacyl-ACP synthase III [bacterium]|nr:ketoacyl-ACP synthase III [bacterium]MCI0604314.1 ketoacyl-ACP synthase III [bacterium]